MTLLPLPQTPLNQHSLADLEIWLKEIGAQPNPDNNCAWSWNMHDWSAEIIMEREELRVIWKSDGIKSQHSFSYGLTRQDVESAMKQGP